MKNILKSALFTLLVPGTVMFLAPCWIAQACGGVFSLEDWRFLGFLPLSVGLAFLLVSVWHFAVTGKGTPAPIDPPKKFVAKGFYRTVRNPMYVGGLLILGGEADLFHSWAVVLYALAVFSATHLFVVFYEEPVLKKKFGASYKSYCKKVPRWIPRFN